MSQGPISYIQRTTDYYLGLGYNNPYQWACFDDVPFTHPNKPLKDECGGCHYSCPLPTRQG